MTDDRLEFYDPLYETIVFERGLPRQGFQRLQPDYPLDPRDIVRTAEFSRLAFLNQVGLAWLIFPSATHTRYAHSIGCWWLGKIAETLIKVRSNSSEKTLHLWLQNLELREEFYLSLLLHDIGHGPLSHVLERNPLFVDALKAAGIKETDHEHRGADLLLGRGPIWEVWLELARRRYGNSTTTFKDLREGTLLSEKVCLPAISYLMTGDKEYLEECNHHHKSELGVVKELVSGLLDLDRLDHYARDSYFSGLRHVSINLRGFLTNLRFEPDGDRAFLSLSADGAAYAAGLLFSKRQILGAMFRTPRAVALHAMANAALTSYLEALQPKERSEASLRIAWMQDAEFLDCMAAGTSDISTRIVQDIRALRPYRLVRKFTRADLPAKITRKSLEAFGGDASRRHASTVLVYFDPGFFDRARPRESQDWLDTGRLILEDSGTPLTEHPDHKADFAYLREPDRSRHVWIFCENDSILSKVGAEVDELIRA